MLTKEELPACPWATAIRLIGSKWKLFILRDLMLYGTCRFSGLMRSIPGISSKVLTDNLRQLETDGILIRTVYPTVPPKVEYTLTGLGESLRPLLDTMGEWGARYQAIVREEGK